MKSIFCYLFIFFPLFFSCNSVTKQGDLLEIPVDVCQNNSLPLSEIAESITAIDLELTDKSLINPFIIGRILLLKDYVIISDFTQILIFHRNGKFIRSIGSKGQGPGEYIRITQLAVDEKNEYLFVVSSGYKIICYDLDGNLIRESYIFQDKWSIIREINYVNNELLIITDDPRGKDARGLYSRSLVFWLDDKLQIIDSLAIRNVYFEIENGFYTKHANYITSADSAVYLYYADLYPNSIEKILRDTLYRMDNNCLIPELKLKFENNGIDGSGIKFIKLSKIYRSSRYVFAAYGNSHNTTEFDYFYFFCYDTKTGNGYNMLEGYTDDIHQIEERKWIYPLCTNTEMFYYWHTHMKPDDLEEPNPTLYIGRLKK